MPSHPIDQSELTKQILDLALGDARVMVAIAGPPGAGKSTLAGALAADLNASHSDIACVVGMDGFHFDDAILQERGLKLRKGAPETFDFDGLAATLERLRKEQCVAIPVFDRSLEISRGSARMVSSRTRILLVEGNYLLLDEHPWDTLKQYFRLTVWIDTPLTDLAKRLTRRWINYGLTDIEAASRVADNDLPNAIRAVRHSVPAEYILHSRDDI